MGRYASELGARFARFAGISPGMCVLDVGCGPGGLTQELAAIAGPDRVFAADPSEEFVDACRRRVPGADVRVSVAEDLPFDDDVFDAVLAQLVVQALDDPLRAGREMARVGAPGGIVALCVWDFRDGMPLLHTYWTAALAVDPTGARLAGGDAENPWCRPEGLRRLLAESGLVEIERGELSASASYDGLDDAWWSFEAGSGPSGAYCRSLGEEQRAALRDEFGRQLGEPDGPFRLTARAWAVRGRVPVP
jgi:ubiquinone/menaquinone biosynthesis C-methylase UbiE